MVATQRSFIFTPNLGEERQHARTQPGSDSAGWKSSTLLRFHVVDDTWDVFPTGSMGLVYLTTFS